MERLDWDKMGREHARKVWAVSDRTLEKLPLDPFAGLFEPRSDEDSHTLRDSYRSELHLLLLRHESSPVAHVTVAQEVARLSMMRRAARRAGLEIAG